MVDEDNEDNAGSGTPDGDMGAAVECLFRSDSRHPIEFNIFVTGGLPTTSAALFLESWDVDYDCGFPPCERDAVYFNDTEVGFLTGANNEWSNPMFAIPLNLVLPGKNVVRIEADTLTGEWCTWIRRAQLLIDGGRPATASCRAIATSQQTYLPGDTGTVIVEADTTLASQNLRFEVNLKNADGQIINGTSRVVTVTDAVDDPQVFMLGLGSAPPGAYSAEALLFDAETGVLQNMCSTTFTVASPLLEVAPDRGHVFPITVVGASRTVTYRIRNVGGGTLNGTASTPCDGFTAAPTTFGPLAASQETTVVVTFTPPGEGTFLCQLEIASNGGNAQRPLSGRGFLPVIPVVRSPVSPAGLVMISLLGIGMLWVLWVRRRA